MTDRTIERVRAYIVAIEVPDRPAFVTPPPRRHRFVPVAAALAVFAVLFIVVVRPDQVLLAPGSADGGTGQAWTFPDQFAAYSYLTASVSESPPGPVIAYYHQGCGCELFDFPQTLVLSAFTDRYRRVDVAENNSGPALLSPAGDRVAVGSRIPLTGLSLVDLVTGQTKLFETPRPFMPVAWSPNFRYIAGVWQGWQHDGGPLMLFEVDTGRVTQLGYLDVSMAAFSPDGSELAVQNGNELLVIDLFGNVRRKLSTGPQLLLNGSSWSPDGKLLITWQDGHGLSFADATGTGAPVPAPLGIGGPQGAAWISERKVLTSGEGLIESDVDTGVSRVISRFNSGPFDNFHMGQMQFAYAMLPIVQVRSAGWFTDRGPLNTWLQLISAGLVLAVLTWLVLRLRRRARARQASSL